MAKHGYVQLCWVSSADGCRSVASHASGTARRTTTTNANEGSRQPDINVFGSPSPLDNDDDEKQQQFQQETVTHAQCIHASSRTPSRKRPRPVRRAHQSTNSGATAHERQMGQPGRRKEERIDRFRARPLGFRAQAAGQPGDRGGQVRNGFQDGARRWRWRRRC